MHANEWQLTRVYYTTPPSVIWLRRFIPHSFPCSILGFITGACLRMLCVNDSRTSAAEYLPTVGGQCLLYYCSVIIIPWCACAEGIRRVISHIVSVFIIHVVKEYQEEVKQLQQEVEERKKMGRARDEIISNLEQEKSQMQKTCETRIVNSMHSTLCT